MSDGESHWRARPLRFHVSEEGVDFVVQLEPTVSVVLSFPEGRGMLDYTLSARDGERFPRGRLLGGSEREFQLLSGEYTLRLSGEGGRRKERLQVGVDPLRVEL